LAGAAQISATVVGAALHLARPHHGVDEFVDLALVANVDATRRFIDDHHRRIGEHDLGKQQLLLVAARHAAGDDTPVAHADIEASARALQRGSLALRAEITVFAMLIPMTLYIIAMVWLGIYLPSVLLIGYFMRRHGKFGWLPSVSVSIAVPLAFFIVFERWFLVPLPKGPIENLLGF
jgi:hypothetical protein